MKSSSVSLPHACPVCSIVAEDSEEAIMFFGLRKFKNDKVYIQSYCRDCRKADLFIKKVK